MRHQAGMPKNMWAKAIKHAIWLKNCTSTRALGNTTLYEKLYGEKPNFMDVPKWGGNVWVHTKKGSKLDMRGLHSAATARFGLAQLGSAMAQPNWVSRTKPNHVEWLEPIQAR
jgi:hypothetical protein